MALFESAPDHIKQNYIQAVSKAAIISATVELRRGEVELKKIKLESIRIDKDLDHLLMNRTVWSETADFEEGVDLGNNMWQMDQEAAGGISVL